MAKVQVLVEGHGEVEAAGNLVTRLAQDIGLSLAWSRPLRWKNLHRRDGLEKGANYIRNKPDTEALLVLRDGDDDCPKDKGPEMASWLRELNLPFPAAIVLLHREYEVLFLPCLHLMAGKPIGSRPGLLPNTKWDGTSWEARRGIKEWLSRCFPPGRSYKPTLDQLPLTRRIDFRVLREASVPCFGTLERALGFLAADPKASGVYPDFV